MKAGDVMASNVITVNPDTEVADVAKILLANRISGAPVVDLSGRLVGIVSEGDLLHRSEAGTERQRPWWLQMLVAKETLAYEFVRTHARKVTDVMTRDVVTVTPDTSLAEVASTLEKYGIKRVPVVRDGKVVGIVSRANLLQALASSRGEEQAVDDAKLRQKIIAALDAQSWARVGLVNVIVRNGTVELWGMVYSPTEKNAVRVAVEAVPGVRAVNDNLRVRPVLAET